MPTDTTRRAEIKARLARIDHEIASHPPYWMGRAFRVCAAIKLEDELAALDAAKPEEPPCNSSS